MPPENDASNVQGANGTPGPDGQQGAPGNANDKNWAPDRKEWVANQQTTRAVDDRTKALETKLDTLIARMGGEGASKKKSDDAAMVDAPDAIQAVHKLRTELAFEKATKGFDDASVKTLARLFGAENPAPEKFAEWFKATTEELGFKPGQTAAAPSRAMGGRNTNTGAPAGGAPATGRLESLPDSQIDAMDPAEVLKKYNEQNGGGNPFKQRRGRGR